MPVNQHVLRNHHHHERGRPCSAAHPRQIPRPRSVLHLRWQPAQGRPPRASSANWSRHGCCCMPKSWKPTGSWPSTSSTHSESTRYADKEATDMTIDYSIKVTQCEPMPGYKLKVTCSDGATANLRHVPIHRPRHVQTAQGPADVRATPKKKKDRVPPSAFGRALSWPAIDNRQSPRESRSVSDLQIIIGIPRDPYRPRTVTKD